MQTEPPTRHRGWKGLLRSARELTSGRSTVATGLTLLAVELASLLLALGTQALLARWLGVATFGVFAYVQSWLAALLMVARGGSELAALRFVPAYAEAGAWGSLARFLRRAFLRVLISGLAVGALVAVGAELLPGVAEVLVQTFWILPLALPVDGLVDVAAASLKGLKRALQAQGIAALCRRGLFGALVAVPLAAGVSGTAPRAMLLYFAASATALLALGILLWRRLPAGLPDAGEPREEGASWRETTFALFAFGLLSVALGKLDTLVLGMLRDTTEAGIYSIASRLAGLALFGQMAVNSVLAPEISRCQVRGAWRELERTAVLCARIATAFALVVALALCLLGPWVLRAFGSAFELAWPPLVILLAGQVVSAACGSVGHLMNMTGNQREALRFLTVLVLVELALLVVLIPAFGALGAACATSAATAALNLGLALRVRKVLGLRSSALTRLEPGS